MYIINEEKEKISNFLKPSIIVVKGVILSNFFSDLCYSKHFVISVGARIRYEPILNIERGCN